MFFRWVGWLFASALVLSFAFAISSFFVEQEDERVLSGVAGLIAFVLGFVTVVLLSINAVAFIVMSALVIYVWLSYESWKYGTSSKPSEENSGDTSGTGKKDNTPKIDN